MIVGVLVLLLSSLWFVVAGILVWCLLSSGLYAYWYDGNRDRRYIGTIDIVIAGIAALSVCRWYVAVRC